MKNKAIIKDKIYTTHTSFVLELELAYNITFIIGDSGVGKSAVYSIINELGTEDPTIKCFNYLDSKKNYKTSIKKTRNKLFVIDNADVLLDDAMRQYIALDVNNQYIIIGRNPNGLLLTQDNIYELVSVNEDRKTIFRLKNV